MTLFRLLTGAALLASFVAAASAADAPAAPARTAPTLTLYIENDYFSGTDRYYTNGVKLSWVSADLTDWGQEGWRRRFVEALPFVNRPGLQKNLSLAFGQNIYTPIDTETTQLVRDDRPYAGWTYLAFGFISRDERRMDALEIHVGLVGPHSAADDTQIVWHSWIGVDRPNGWENQLKDEPGLNVVYERKWRSAASTREGALGFDFIPHAGFSLGNVQTYANLGGTVRLGLNLPQDFGPTLIRGGGETNAPLGPDGASWGLHLFGGVDGRAVARDLFLDGNTWRDSHSVDKEAFVADLFLGVGLVAFRDWKLTYTWVRRSKEFKLQRDPNEFGSVALTKRF